MKNAYEFYNETLFLYLDRENGEKLRTAVDRDQFEKWEALGAKWCASWDATALTHYALAHGFEDAGGIKLHRFVLDAPEGAVIDHGDHDGLNNRRSNLTVGTHASNMANRRIIFPPAKELPPPAERRERAVAEKIDFRYPFVSFDGNEAKWAARVTKGGARIRLGIS